MTPIGKTGDARFQAVDIDLHKVLASGAHTPELGAMLPGAADAIRSFLNDGLTVYISCGGFASNPSFVHKVEAWLDSNDIPANRIKFREKPRTLAVVDDHAIPFDGDWSAVTHEVMRRAHANNPETPTSGGQMLKSDIVKTDNDRQIVFGWASVSVSKDGNLLVDKQDDVILPQDLEDAAYDFVLHSRMGDEMHDGSTKATLIESFVLTAEKMDKMGLSFIGVQKADRDVCMWWCGWKVADSLWPAIKAGKYSAFSIGGSAARVPIN